MTRRILRALLLILALISVLGFSSLQLGCGSSEVPKTDDPNEIEQERKEHLDMSQKERNG